MARYAVLCTLLVACESTPTYDGPPTITLLEPADEATVCTTFHVVMAIENLTLVDPNDPPDPLPPDSGHVDVMINGQDVEMLQGEELDITWDESPLLQLKAELSNADHTPIEPYAGDFVYVTTSAAACSS